MSVRPQVSLGGNGGLSLRPIASPVDTFKEQRAGQQLAQLATGLAQFAPSLARYGDVQYEKQSKEAQERGAQIARELHEKRIEFRDAVKQGIISAEKNPFFLVGLKEQTGKALAGDYANDLKIAAATDGSLQESTDLNDFRAFESTFRGQWLKEHVGEDNRDVHFERGFGNLADAYTLDQENQFASLVAQRLNQTASEAVYSQVFQTLRDHAQESPETISQMISGTMNSILIDNPKIGRMVSLGAAKAVTDYAVRNHDLTVLKLIDQIPGGPGSSLVRPEVTDMVHQAEGIIRQDKEGILRLAADEEEVADKQASDTLWTDLGKALDEAKQHGSLNAFNLGPWKQRMRSIDPRPGAVEQITTFWENVLKPKDNDGSVFRNTLMMIHGIHPTDQRTITASYLGSLMAGGRVTVEQYSFLKNQIDERDRTDGEGGSGIAKALRDPIYTKYEQMLKQRFVSEYGYNDANVRNMASNAQGYFLEGYLRWLGKNPQADDGARQQYLAQAEQDEFFRSATDTDLQEAFLTASKGDGASLTEPISSDSARKVLSSGGSAGAKKPAGPPPPISQAGARPLPKARWTGVKAEITEWVQGSRRLSPATLALLRAQGVPPTKEAVVAWVTATDKLPDPSGR